MATASSKPSVKTKDLSSGPTVFHRFQFAILLSISFLVSLLNRKAMVRVGRLYGGVSYLLWRRRRKIAMANLHMAFGKTRSDKEKAWIARECFKNVGATFMEFGWGMRTGGESICNPKGCW